MLYISWNRSFVIWSIPTRKLAIILDVLCIGESNLVQLNCHRWLYLKNIIKFMFHNNYIEKPLVAIALEENKTIFMLLLFIVTYCFWSKYLFSDKKSKQQIGSLKVWLLWTQLKGSGDELWKLSMDMIINERALVRIWDEGNWAWHTIELSR